MAVQLASWSGPAATALACVLTAACGAGQTSPPGGTSGSTPTVVLSATPALEAAPAFARKSATHVLPGDWAVVAVADVNEDGKPDVVATTLTRFGMGVLIGQGDGTFADAADIEVAPTDFVRAADLDGDGHLDLIAAGLRFVSPGGAIVLIFNTLDVDAEGLFWVLSEAKRRSARVVAIAFDDATFLALESAAPAPAASGERLTRLRETLGAFGVTPLIVGSRDDLAALFTDREARAEVGGAPASCEDRESVPP